MKKPHGQNAMANVSIQMLTHVMVPVLKIEYFVMKHLNVLISELHVD